MKMSVGGVGVAGVVFSRSFCFGDGGTNGVGDRDLISGIVQRVFSGSWSWRSRSVSGSAVRSRSRRSVWGPSGASTCSRNNASSAIGGVLGGKGVGLAGLDDPLIGREADRLARLQHDEPAFVPAAGQQ